MHAIVTNSKILNELTTVKEWLYDTAPEPEPVEAADGYWRFTKHRIVHTLRTRTVEGGVVRSMDPDAPEREDKAIAAEDAVRTSFRTYLDFVLITWDRLTRISLYGRCTPLLERATLRLLTSNVRERVNLGVQRV